MIHTSVPGHPEHATSGVTFRPNAAADVVGGLWCPVSPRAVSQGAIDLAQHEALDWSQKTGLVRSPGEWAWAAAWNVAAFAARVYADADDLALAAQWILWMDVIDDAVETLTPAGTMALLEPLTCVFVYGEHRPDGCSADSLAEPLADLWRRTKAGMSETWCDRISRLWQQCAAAMPWEAAIRAAGKPPPLDDYIHHRATAGAAHLALALTEGLYKYELPDALHHSGPLNVLRMLACDQICWANDLFSLDREVQRGDVLNLVLVLEQAPHGLSRTHALETTLHMANERMQALMLLVDTLPAYQRALRLHPAERTLMDQAVDTIEQWVAGSLEFHRLSTRHTDHYMGRTNPFRSHVHPMVPNGYGPGFQEPCDAE
ncbi:terpene synthase family protein [Streptomyces spectabilis]|uniref:Terpene synthase n=1 Tax=Streptomyces spectabilis TaxID=68270 RepID=A0A7W8EZI7_STRST|nr:hypothetical protein [Streptomyces spectabilis]MBB5109931.1 hypothetical protein [Streptomyces spectabilis]GGV55956.1 hypothetical protein GCM10010245_88750 [Streptomyces spectabilis]